MKPAQLTTRQATPPTATPLTPIRVRALHFCIQGGRNVPLTGANGGVHVITAKAKGDRLIAIQYEPWQRHHRVTEYENGKVKIQFCVPESWATYVPDDPTLPEDPEPTE